VLQSLPRQGSGLSFEKLAQEITRDVHPRSLLGELCRLGLARHDEGRDLVELIMDSFVPRGDKARMLGFLGANVGDHFEAAVSNVLGDGREHFEQAIFADELSAESVKAFRETITRQWQTLRAAAVPALETLIDVDRAMGRAQDQRLRIGLFSWNEPMHSGTPNAAGSAPPSPAAGPVAGNAAGAAPETAADPAAAGAAPPGQASGAPHAPARSRSASRRTRTEGGAGLDDNGGRNPERKDSE